MMPPYVVGVVFSAPAVPTSRTALIAAAATAARIDPFEKELPNFVTFPPCLTTCGSLRLVPRRAESRFPGQGNRRKAQVRPHRPDGLSRRSNFVNAAPPPRPPPRGSRRG